MKITIIGSGTAGLVTALMLRQSFPIHDINIISSSSIGIIGVGEGSTEHWKTFMQACNIPLAELIVETSATHKSGIRFENWTNHTPDYFHSVSSSETYGFYEAYGLYAGLIAQGKTLTENIGARSIIENKVPANNPHESVNQYHFDTFKLNAYLTKLCKERNIFFLEDEVTEVDIDTLDGYINSIKLKSGNNHYSDFWVDSSGFKRVLISKLKNDNWNSFSDYLLMNSAIAFPTESDPSGEIRPYTRARATKNGWMWEIPTQERRGNGYVFNSSFLSVDEAIEEASVMTGYVVDSPRIIKFEAGHLKEMWVKNCVAIGLSSSFVEPIEATSIGSTILQSQCLIENLSSYKRGNTAVQKIFNKKMNNMMENILAMIRLHYISDRRDSDMWVEQSRIKNPPYLQDLLDLWNERPPFKSDIPISGYNLFYVPHFYHVAQGQKLINKESCQLMIDNFNIHNEVKYAISSAKIGQTNFAKVDHAQALRELQI